MKRTAGSTFSQPCLIWLAVIVQKILMVSPSRASCGASPTRTWDVIYTTHSGDGRMNVYPIRAVRTPRWKYIRNLRPDCYHSNHSDIFRKDGAGAYWDSWDTVAAKDPKAAAIVQKYYVRPAVELYDTEKDPTEQNNLANNPEYAEQIKKMSAMLDAWMKEQGDTQQVFKEPYPITGPRPVEVNAKLPQGEKKRKKQ